ncbi:protein OBERON 4-like [Impatiens glandulifera]|uniref:protein OBERON 4-like n=1 Tax=Impatiens glandulifera TaxID=253017 RepID=UPI001FB0D332|nr:protein OBERON 4-like [Impatiens glandulifera]
MKRLRSSDDLNSFGEKSVSKDWGRRRDEDANLGRSSSHKSFYYRPENGRKGVISSSSRYDRLEDDHESSQMIRKRSDYDSESYDRRKSYDSYKNASDKGILSSPRMEYGGDRFHRSESFSVSRREVPKGFRSERDRSWRRYPHAKDFDEGSTNRSAGESRSSKVVPEDKTSSRDVKSPNIMSKDSVSEQSKSVELKKSEELLVVNHSSSEREEGELEPESDSDSGVQMTNRNEHLVEDSGAFDLNTCQNDKTVVHEENPVIEHLEDYTNRVTEVGESTNEQTNSDQEELPIPKDASEAKLDSLTENDIYGLKSIPSEDEPREILGVELEARSGDTGLAQSNLDKGKSIVVQHELREDVMVKVKEGGSKSSSTSSDNHIDEIGMRGLDLFSRDPVRGEEKPKVENKMFESLDLSLSLPNVLLPINLSKNLPGSPTNSDGFTMSVSASGTQAFSHNLSCSLTQNTTDNCEGSVKSRLLFQGIDQGWNTEPIHKGVSSPQRISLTGDSFFHDSQVDGQGIQRQRIGSAEGSSTLAVKMRLGHKNILEDGRAFSRDKTHEHNFIGGSDSAESIIDMMVSEPLHVTSNIFNEMSGQSIGCLKVSVHNIISDADKQLQLRAMQKGIHDRPDITMDKLMKMNRTQLEILVALVTGQTNFLQKNNNDASISNLAEIFLNLRCKNIACMNLLPVDECDCKVCEKKSGFCSNCMCLVCSKFDMAYNTCSWVGCDVCSHWCHANCALLKSYIRNGHSISSEVQVAAETQFHCVACGHRSEMFGFVKEVFQNFAREWTAEVLFNELECVKRIFYASEDVRGRRLHEIAVQMLLRLANNSNLQEVQYYILGFLSDSNSSKYADLPTATRSGPSNKNQEAAVAANGFPAPSHEVILSKPQYPLTQLEKPSSSSLRGLEFMQKCKDPLDSDTHWTSSQKEPVFDELESIVRIKQAEAKMYQTRADDARREGEDLKRIVSAKKDMIEEEYVLGVAKLRMEESKAEEMQKKKLEEFESVERAYREYLDMKTRMEIDIKELLLKIEAAKRNLTM